MIRNYFISVFLFLLSTSVFAQHETDNWYFGNYAGLNFASAVPKVLHDGALSRWEGVATFSDSIGNLLFYTDGTTVWNRNHQVMVNGTDLKGDYSSTECAIIVPYPQHNNLYFIFTVDDSGGPDGLQYSIVDMNLDNGNGAVSDIKNVPVQNNVCEKITAVRKSDGINFWLLSRSSDSDYFSVYEITSGGFSASSRVDFHIGFNFADQLLGDPTYTIGYMRVSPNGKKLAVANAPSGLLLDNNPVNFLEIFDFDPATGVLSNNITVWDFNYNIYGTEFSNDASMLYFTSDLALFQLDLTSENPETIATSLTKIYESDVKEIRNPASFLTCATLNYKFGALQLASNGKIYMVNQNSPYVAVINNPREKGEACNFDFHGVDLGGKIIITDDCLEKSGALCGMGLPNFITSYFLPPEFEISFNCRLDSTVFTVIDTRNISDIQWVLTKLDGTEIMRNNQKSFYAFLRQSDFYKISLTFTVDSREYSQYKIFKVYDNPLFSLGTDVNLCEGDTFNFSPSKMDNCTFSLNRPDTVFTKSDTIIEYMTDTYSGCIFSDTLNLNFRNAAPVSLEGKDSICVGDSSLIRVLRGKGVKNFCLWNNTSDTLFYLKTPGSYFVIATDTLGCFASDTLNFVLNSLPQISLADSGVICKGNHDILDCGVNNARYLWNTGETTRSISISSPGIYSVTVIDKNLCRDSSIIAVSEETLPEFSLGNDTVLCEDQTLTLIADCTNAENYLWSDNSASDRLEISVSGNYQLTASNYCGFTTQSINVDFQYCGELVFPNIITPDGNRINDCFKVKGLTGEGWHFIVMNRWGNIVYESLNYANDWHGDDLPDGVYYWLMQKGNLDWKGFVHVYRK